MVAFIEVTITSLMKSPLIEVIVTSPINEQMVGAIVLYFLEKLKSLWKYWLSMIDELMESKMTSF